MNEVLGVKYNVGDLLKEKEIHRDWERHRKIGKSETRQKRGLLWGDV